MISSVREISCCGPPVTGARLFTDCFNICRSRASRALPGFSERTVQAVKC